MLLDHGLDQYLHYLSPRSISDLSGGIHSCAITDGWHEPYVILHHLGRIVTCEEENPTAQTGLILL